MNPSWNRRDFIKLLGGATAASLTGLLPRPSLANDPPQQRVIFYTTPNGSRIIGGWRPLLNSGDRITAASLQPILQPLAPFVDQMLLIEGLDLATSYFLENPYPGVRQDGHAARSSLWTGWALNGLPTCQGDSGFATGPSMDRLVARGWGLDPADNHIVKIGRKGGCVFSHTSAYHAGENSPVVGEFSQQAYFQKLWGEQAPPTTLERAKRARRRSFEMARVRLRALRERAAPVDGERFGRHMQALQRSIQSLDLEPLACDAPAQPTDPEDLNLFRFNYVPFTETWFDLLAAAVRCRASRIFGVSWGDEGATGHSRWLNSTMRNGLHVISHEADQNSDAHQVMVDFNRFQAQQLARFMGLLAAMPESDGSSVLDNTLIVWGQPMSEGATHASRNLPFVLLGGRNTRLRMGHYHNFGSWPARRKYADHGGRPHTLLLTSILHALGIADVDHVGHAAISDKGNLDQELFKA